MNLLFDTETSGLMKPDLDPLDPSQPHMVQLGAQLFDKQWRKRGHMNVLIKPDGWEIEPGAEEVHGISTQTCHRYGVSAAQALVLFQGLAGCAARIIGHHVQFDRTVVAAALKRAGGEGVWWARMGTKMFCTMEESTQVLQIPGEFGFKFPTLEEARARLAPDAPVPGHDADSDIAATMAVYRALIAGGHATEADPYGIKL